uniref:type I protein arginine methyltransferase n=1 Tax=Strombidinopsis acuminata TaxID=141414 RepID=A0A7S3RFB1_9SPIT
MLQDHIRTSLYQFAILENAADFRDKTVLDVGAGTGILSFFAAQAGAAHVYAVEASGMARYAQRLAEANRLGDVVSIINQRVEEVILKNKVDVLISEPLGIALVNERMLESYLIARDNLLKPGGKMFPDAAVLFAAPFTDPALYLEQQQKLGFWTQTNFYGIDLTNLQADAEKFYFSQPVVGPVAPGSLLSPPTSLHFDFNTMSLAQLQKFEMPFSFVAAGMAQLHGFALWFDCRFPGTQRHIHLSTAPHEPLTHWYQVRALLKAPIAVGAGHTLEGRLDFEANDARGYNVHMHVRNANTGVSASNVCVTQCALHHFQYSSQTSQSTPAFFGAAETVPLPLPESNGHAPEP